MVPIETVFFAFLIVLGIAIVRQANLFAAAMMTGIFSLVSAALFTLMNAVDVAFTEAAVGAGISTVLILGTLSVTAEREEQQPFRWLPLGIVCLTGATLVYGVADMPPFGDPSAPIHHHLAPEYIQDTAAIFHIPNIVTAILGSYRGYDTFGETTVIFAATVGVLLLLSSTDLSSSLDE